MPPKKKPPDFEAAIERLEQITAQLEEGEISLDDSIKAYTEGVEIAKLCNDKLADAEKKIRLIRTQGGMTTEEEFEVEDDND